MCFGIVINGSGSSLVNMEFLKSIFCTTRRIIDIIISNSQVLVSRFEKSSVIGCNQRVFALIVYFSSQGNNANFIVVVSSNDVCVLHMEINGENSVFASATSDLNTEVVANDITCPSKRYILAIL